MCDAVEGERLPWAQRDWEGAEKFGWFTGHIFRACAYHTATNIFFNGFCKKEPPVESLNQVKGLFVARMFSRKGVVELNCYQLLELGSWYHNLVLVEESVAMEGVTLNRLSGELCLKSAVRFSNFLCFLYLKVNCYLTSGREDVAEKIGVI